jgi:hypothetical protein
MSEIAYDETLQADLEENALDLMREGLPVQIAGMANSARYNAALWFAMKWGLRYEYDGEQVTIYPPD